MRRKKHKHTRRSVAFYKVHHGFREPYKVSKDKVYAFLRSGLVQTLNKQWWLLQVLLDGNFIHATLGAKCVLFLQLLALRMHQLLQPVNSCGTWFS